MKLRNLVIVVLVLAGAACAQVISGTSVIAGQSQFGNGSDFSISVSPSSLSVAAGSNVTATVTITSLNAFNSPVSISGGSGPVGATYGFSPNPVTPPVNSTATSTLTLTAAASAPGTTCPATGQFVITATSGAITHTATACVAITSSPPETLTIQIVPGAGAPTVTVDSGSLLCNGFGLCHASYSVGTVVTITAHPNGATFLGWNGACTGNATTCVVTMNSNVSVQALFTTQLLSYAARTDACVFNNTGSPATGELLASACSGNAACLANACSGGATGTQGSAMSYTGGPTSVPPAPGSTVSGTNIYGLNSYLVGLNTPMTDPDFGTSMIRAWDAVIQNSVTCLGGGRFGIAAAGVGAGSNLVWAADDSAIIVKSIGGSANVLAFYPDTSTSSTVGTVAPSSLCGGYFPGGATFDGADPHVIYNVVTDQENTVTISGSTGTGITPEPLIQATTNAKATLQAVNSSFIQIGVVTGTADNSHDWVGQTSGAHFTPTVAPPSGTSNTPYANSVYKGIKCDGVSGDPDESVCQKNPNASPSCVANDTNPRCWYVYYTLVFEFNYLPAMTSDPHFPTGDHCLPQNFNANYNGSFAPSSDGTTFTIVFGDNGQANHTGYNGGGSGPGWDCPQSPEGICQGPVYMATFRSSNGCRMINTMTDKLVGDWGTGSPGPTQIIDSQANDILGAVTGTLTPGDAFKQLTTGALTQLVCMQDATHTCQPSGWTQMYTGVVYGSPDNSHAWQDCGNNYPTTTCSGSNFFTPSAVPTNAPFLYPDVLHDMTQAPNSGLASFSMVQVTPSTMTLADTGGPPFAITYTAATQLTTVLYSNYNAGKGAVYSPGQQFNFSGLRGAHAAHFNCTSANQCPIFTAVAIKNTGSNCTPFTSTYCPSGSNGTITISDPTGGGSDFTDSENQSGCGGSCPGMYPHPQDENLTAGGFGGTNFYQVGTLLVAADLMATGHHAAGCCHFFQGKFYTTINEAAPWTLATVPHVAGPAACNLSGSPCGDLYVGPLTPPPSADHVNLVPFSITDDQHGDQGCAGTNDQCPPTLATALVCGQAGSGGVGGFPCPASYLSVWDTEIIAAQNAALQSTPGSLVGADCSYTSSGALVGCIYRLAHCFNTGGSFNFTTQNCQGAGSPDGLFYIFPSDWNLTLGCMDGTTTNCWSSWEATAPNASTTAATWTNDGSGNIKIVMPNQFCPPSGTQFYCAAGGSGSSCGSGKTIQTLSCGTRAGTVKLTGFSESWLNNQTLTLDVNTANNWGCDSTTASAGNCTAFVLHNVAGATAGPGTEVGTQKATPTPCSSGVPCPIPDVFIAKVTTAHQ